MTIWRMRIACWIPKATRHTLRIRNTYCFSAAKLVRRTSRYVRLYEHCLSFYIIGSMHLNSILIRSNKMQQYASIYLVQNHSTCFGCPSHPSSGGEHKTVTAASSTGHSNNIAKNLPPAWPMANGHAGGRFLLCCY